MAVANMAVLLAQQDLRVLVIDFDLEAPGLHRYFLTHPENNDSLRFLPMEEQFGVIDFFTHLRKQLEEKYPDTYLEHLESLGSQEAKIAIRPLVASLIDSERYLYEVFVHNPNLGQASSKLDFMPAGRFDASYPALVRDFAWADFYERYYPCFPALVDELRSRYDYILIDSRTGITDVGSICTVTLPDKLVLVFSPNQQSLHGAAEVGRQAVRERATQPDRQSLSIFPLLCRIDEGEEELKRTWIDRTSKRISLLFSDLYQIEHANLSSYFDSVKIPHRTYYAYGERIAAEEQRITESGSLSEAFSRFLEWLRKPSLLTSTLLDGLPRSSLSPTTSSEAISTTIGDIGILAGSYLIQKRLLGPEHPDVARSLSQIAEAYRTKNQLPEAEELLKRALDLSSRSSEPASLEVAQLLGRLAEVQRARGKYMDASATYARQLELLEHHRGSIHPEVAQAAAMLAECFRAQSKYSQAEESYRKALSIRQKLFGPAHPSVIGLVKILAETVRQQQRYEDAEQLYRHVLEHQIAQLGEYNPDVADTLYMIAEVFRARSQYSEAEHFLRQSLHIRELILGTDDTQVGLNLSMLGEVLRQQHRIDEATAHYERALAIFEKARGSENSHTKQIREALSSIRHLKPKRTAARNRVIILSNLLLGVCKLRPEISSLLADLEEHPPARLILAGGAFAPQGHEKQFPVGEDVIKARRHIQKAAHRGTELTLLLSPWENWATRSEVASWLEVPGLRFEDPVSKDFPATASTPLHSRLRMWSCTKLDATRQVWVVVAPCSNPLEGLSWDSLLRPVLGGLVQIESTSKAPEKSLTHRFSQALHRVIETSHGPRVMARKLNQFLERSLHQQKPDAALETIIPQAALVCMSEVIGQTRVKTVSEAKRNLSRLFEKLPGIDLELIALDWLQSGINTEAKQFHQALANSLRALDGDGIVGGLDAGRLQAHPLGRDFIKTGSAANGEWVELDINGGVRLQQHLGRAPPNTIYLDEP